METTPDWGLWLSVPGAALWECVALSLGFDPDAPHAFTSTTTQTDEYQQRLTLLRKHVSRGCADIQPVIGTLDRNSILTRVTVRDFARWAEKQAWQLPEPLWTKPKQPTSEALAAELAQARAAIEAQAAELDRLRTELAALETAPAPPAGGELHPKSRNTAARIIAGLVLAHYGTSAHGRIEGISEVLGELERVGVTVGEDALRQWLKDGSALIPQPART